jgi:hypothetical protein
MKIAHIGEAVLVSQFTNSNAKYSGNTLPDIPKNNVLPAHWPSFGQVKLTHKINCHRVETGSAFWKAQAGYIYKELYKCSQLLTQ